MRKLIYMAAPVRPTADELAVVRAGEIQSGEGPTWGDAAHRAWDADTARLALRRNIDRACRWLTWLGRSFPEVTFIAPWISAILAGDDDSDPAQREAGLVDAETVIARCDGIALVGGRLSDGMRREMLHFIHESAIGEGIYDFLRFQLVDPPKVIGQGCAFGVTWGLEDWRVKR